MSQCVSSHTSNYLTLLFPSTLLKMWGFARRDGVTPSLVKTHFERQTRGAHRTGRWKCQVTVGDRKVDKPAFLRRSSSLNSKKSSDTSQTTLKFPLTCVKVWGVSRRDGVPSLVLTHLEAGGSYRASRKQHELPALLAKHRPSEAHTAESWNNSAPDIHRVLPSDASLCRFLWLWKSLRLFQKPVM